MIQQEKERIRRQRGDAGLDDVLLRVHGIGMTDGDMLAFLRAAWRLRRLARAE